MWLAIIILFLMASFIAAWMIVELMNSNKGRGIYK